MHPSLPSALLLFLAQSTIVASTAAAPNNGQHKNKQRHHQHVKRAAAAEANPDPDPLLIIETVYRTEWAEAVTTVWATEDETPVTSTFSTSSTVSESEIRVTPVQRQQQRPTDDPQPKPEPNRLWPAPAVRPQQTEAREPPASILAALPSPWQDAPNAPDPEPQRPDASQLAALPSPYEPPPDPPKPKAGPPPPPKPKSDPPPPASGGGGGGNSDPRCTREGTLEPWQKEVLDAHNDRRLRHPVDAQCWHEGLAAAAAKAAALCNWAHTLEAGKDICGFEEGFMQNYVASSRDGEPGLQVKQQWYDGEQKHYAADGNYDRDNPKPVPLGPNGQPLYETGHFSAMVWKDSTFVGCARKFCPGGITGLGGSEKYFMVCDYALPGNMGGQYRKQVLRPRVG